MVCNQNILISHNNLLNGFNLTFADKLSACTFSTSVLILEWRNLHFINTIRKHSIWFKHVMCSSFIIGLGAIPFSFLISLSWFLKFWSSNTCHYHSKKFLFFSFSLFIPFLPAFPSSCLPASLHSSILLFSSLRFCCFFMFSLVGSHKASFTSFSS